MLTPKQEQFAINIFNGMNQADAYRNSYNAENMSDNAIYREACLLMARPKIAQRIQELRDKAAKAHILTAQERLQYLTDIITGAKGEKVLQVVDGEAVETEIPASVKNKLNAIDIMNKMQGEYVQKIAADVDTNVTINIELSDDE